MDIKVRGEDNAAPSIRSRRFMLWFKAFRNDYWHRRDESKDLTGSSADEYAAITLVSWTGSDDTSGDSIFSHLKF